MNLFKRLYLKKLEADLFPVLDRIAFIIGFLKVEHPEIEKVLRVELHKRFGKDN